MGKYQLDDKGRAQVTRYHEKHSRGGINKKARVKHMNGSTIKFEGHHVEK